MEKQAEICETYQLKWSSYNAYIHSCIATSLHNDSFADVALVTVDGHQIMAHRFVLSYSSHFLNQVLKFQPKVTTALPLMIVMPPEIDYKSLKVLVRYMYSGEAKVSKEILNNVLRGGDILQIKGLYREKEDSDKNAKIKISQNSQNTQKVVNATATTTVAGTSTSTSTSTATTTTQSSATKPSHNVTTTTTTTQNSTTKPSQSVANKPPPAPVVPAQPQDKTPQPSPQTPAASGAKFLVVQKPKEPQKYTNPRQKVLNFTIMQSFDKTGQNSKEPATILNKTMDQNKKADGGGDQGKKKDEQSVTVKSEPSPTKESIQYQLMIKDEPIEWTDADMELIDSKEVFDDNMTIKSENTEQESESNEEEESLFSPLTCELCTETFTIPAEWVRHVQTHTDMLPAKRRRRDSPGDSYENDTFPELMCDMCQKSFPTPAEWVHHIQNTHTEFELHLSNKTNHRNKPVTPLEVATTSEATKKCTECDKTFPSHASMIIHRRRHTGEKPYNCEYCNKSFNVKSNLLRHLRTLHNKIINSTDVETRDTSDNSN